MTDYRSLEQKIRQVWIDEAEARGTAIRRKIENVGRPADNVKDYTSKLAKQTEIKTKIIDEANDDPTKVQDKDKKKDKGDGNGDMDDDDAKLIKGGKTQVDLHPHTNDKPEDANAEDKTSKKATNKANKEIGAKSKSVKESVMDTTKNFGLPDSLIATVLEAMKGKCPKCGMSPCQCGGDPKVAKEELVGGQKKLDKNHNGKLDKQDFKMIRKEEVEELDELSKKTLGSYVKKATDDATDAARRGGAADAKKAPSFAKSAYKTVEKRTAGIAKATDKLTKEEVVDEGKGPNGNPLVHADATTKARNPLVYADKKKTNPLVYRDKHRDNPMVFGKKKMTKEEVEAIDEGNPANKEKKNAAATEVGAKNRDDKHLGSRGMKTSVADKIRGRQIQKEEVEFSEAELARIEAIAKGME